MNNFAVGLCKRRFGSLGLVLSHLDCIQLLENSSIRIDSSERFGAVVGPDSIEDLPIRRLLISNCPMPPVWAIRLPPSLEILSITGCSIRKFDISFPDTIEFIGLANNKLTDLPDLSHLTYLQAIDLRENRLIDRTLVRLPPNARLVYDD